MVSPKAVLLLRILCQPCPVLKVFLADAWPQDIRPETSLKALCQRIPARLKVRTLSKCDPHLNDQTSRPQMLVEPVLDATCAQLNAQHGQLRQERFLKYASNDSCKTEDKTIQRQRAHPVPARLWICFDLGGTNDNGAKQHRTSAWNGKKPHFTVASQPTDCTSPNTVPQAVPQCPLGGDNGSAHEVKNGGHN